MIMVMAIKRKTIAIFTLVVSGMVGLCQVPVAEAAYSSNWTYGPVDSSATQNKKLYYVVVNTSYTVNARQVLVPVYSKTAGSVEVVIGNITPGNNNARSATFRQQGQPSPSQCTNIRSGECRFRVNTTPDANTGLYRAVVQADYNSRPGDSTSDDAAFIAFRVIVQGAGQYVGGGANFNYATQMLWPYDTGDGGDYTINLATPCNVTTASPVRWMYFYDLDSQLSANSNKDIRVEVKRYPQGTYVPVQVMRDATQSGAITPVQGPFSLGKQGNNAETRVGMVFEPDQKYTIRFSTLNGVNTMVYKLPYDTINFNVSCNQFQMSPTTNSSQDLINAGDTAEFSHSVTVTGSQVRGNTKFHSWAFVVPANEAASFNRSAKAESDNDACNVLYGNNKQCQRTDGGGDPTNNINWTGGATRNLTSPGGGTAFNIDTSGLSLSGGELVCSYVAIERPYTSIARSGKDPNTLPRWKFSAPRCVKVGMRPSVQIWGNDLRTGSTFSGVGNQTTGVTGVVSQKSGSWGEYSILSPGAVDRFASESGAANGSTGAQSAWSGLTFANNISSTGCATLFGCFAGASAMGKIPEVEKFFTGGNGSSVYYDRGNQSFSTSQIPSFVPGTNLGNLTRSIVVKTTGNVTVDGNISYNNGSMESAGEIPQLVIIANNITIVSNVTNVDAWLIAKNDLATCDVNSSNGSFVNTCRNGLRINGPVMASRTIMRRTTFNTSDPKQAAETVNLRGDAYIWANQLARSAGKWQTVYTTELPPRY